MKLLNKKIIGCIGLLLLLSGSTVLAQDTEKNNVSLSLNYYLSNNSVPYLLVRAKTKIEGKFKPVTNIPVSLYLDKEDAATLIGKVNTNDKGEATAIIPASLKQEWNTTLKHTFLASFEGNKSFDSVRTDLTVGKAKIIIDTTSDRKVTATVYEMKDTVWTPVKGVELKIAVRRLDADLSVNETATFTTDSTGTASADFKRDSIPGDAKGNIILIAKVEDNDQYGNLLIEKEVPWGGKFVSVSEFDRRTLFATRDKAPLWLQFIAYSIVIVVWGILIMLVLNVFKIKKLGEVAVS